ncbi:NAD-dependent epimerase/dehydratase family protein [Gilvimarinus agarilyticus]|uniref:NAD-dependent epimerase/dehydratase family protein n=1 Tax=Gilvimarinus sp. 2_MG-2023 TaxID=3062666 RepID=UPI001C0A6249|nr:NAD-dependent epimerase/dehydratase family protein [Gilvimarinus sp. 2_MG-2023]MBU2884393.1 NAD-dependent epimerase/dehydratase family protein [Gilvimarinus agarilyticus]MDO6569529.1 NAD-dependent epimerase/dehydratase family protein [Gilvimarinus sp. 2_MG-2023]
MNRRDFIRTTGLLSTVAMAPHSLGTKLLKGEQKEILILGGTRYTGPAIVEKLLAQGHNITLFNRGQTNPQLFPKVEKLRGDRYQHRGKGLAALAGKRRWDVIIDTWNESPLCVRDTLKLLAKRCEQYIYISSMAVYPYQALQERAGITESFPLPDDTMPSNYTMIDYDAAKRIADKMVSSLPHGCILRPHSISGARMTHVSDNQRYWPVRLQQGGIIAAPGDGADTTQFIDMKDMARFIALAIEDKLKGAFNTFTTERFDAYLYGLKALSAKPSELIWIPHEHLAKEKFRPYVDIPMWAPRQKDRGTFAISTQKAVNAGYQTRPIAETFRDLLVDFYEQEEDTYDFATGKSKAGLSRMMEKDLLKKYFPNQHRGS